MSIRVFVFQNNLSFEPILSLTLYPYPATPHTGTGNTQYKCPANGDCRHHSSYHGPCLCYPPLCTSKLYLPPHFESRLFAFDSLSCVFYAARIHSDSSMLHVIHPVPQLFNILCTHSYQKYKPIPTNM